MVHLYCANRGDALRETGGARAADAVVCTTAYGLVAPTLAMRAVDRLFEFQEHTDVLVSAVDVVGKVAHQSLEILEIASQIGFAADCSEGPQVDGSVPNIHQNVVESDPTVTRSSHVIEECFDGPMHRLPDPELELFR